jgi:hypothetical protein
VNTVVVVRGGLGLSDRGVAVAFAAYGVGSMVAALALPRLLAKVADRTAMLAGAGLGVAFAVMAVLAVVGMAAAARLWPARDPEEVEHEHVAQGADDPHLHGAPGAVALGGGRYRHRHVLVIDERHPRWPSGGG